ncbi:putative Galactoside 2-alpha-L-fucosyltransferase [Tripterygium wilfordii]|uniref:Fucosyltransferase n=1 Tax=Tripterygium wilfordii TaxID=458696 RepID=A0A7J7BZL4_TRIWF|nr:galactoside 2-alpha-L-fucosyltransferase-like [Tripterygium wilfordii]KAF5727288.1 putative Galactoside 2-alpha-L-fucosyltransferase [Tripterygium wilfordii]
MDLISFRRRLSPTQNSDRLLSQNPQFPLKRYESSSSMRLTKILAACLMTLPVLVLFFIIFRHQPSDRTTGFADARVLDDSAHQNATPVGLGSEDHSSQPTDIDKEKLLDGLLAAGFDEVSCFSRYQSFLYRKTSPYKPSGYLVSKLRSYEDLHKRCGPNTQSYINALERFKSGHTIHSTECRYLVWISFSGLGNRILTLASAYLYALLTDRVLLVDRGKDMADLFCEPFPGNSWLLPLDFPLSDQFNSFDMKSPQCYGNMLKNHLINTSTDSVPSYLYLHLAHDYEHHDKLFFCEDDQNLFGKVPWLIMKTDNYFVPSLFLVPSFEQELSKLFPEKGTVFHHLGRYLFLPSNPVWALITRYYHSYMAKADERIGIQVRVFDSRPGPFKHVMDQILACTLREKLLPEVDLKDSTVTPLNNPRLKAVLLTSLSSGYSENLKDMYWEHPTVTGEVVGVYQPSHEGFQQTEKQVHNRKAWAEMYLLSLTDVLVTSSWSTFGYVAQGLGGLRPWILYKPENDTTPDPPCRRAMSMEPCFHAPPFYDCKAKTGIDTGAVVPHVRHCEDMSWGLKVVDGHDGL